MNLNSVEVKGYRNLENNSIYPEDGINIIYGKNAQGKTNFIESMWMITGGRSFRGTKDIDIIRFGEQKTSISGIINSKERTNRITIDIADGKRTANLNGFNEGPAPNVIGVFRATIFSPSHLSIIKDGPDIRRRMIDAAICQIKPVYTKTISGFNRTLKHRNALLREISQNHRLSDMLDVWDVKLSEYGSEVISERLKYLSKLTEAATEIYSGLSEGKEKMEIHYQSPGLERELKTKEEIYPELLDRLKKSRDSDINTGITSTGAHRHDLRIVINGKPVKAFGSQGQQRSCALAIKLSESRVIEKMSGEKPVIFLDDVMSELDEARRKYTTECMSGFQVFITCCDRPQRDNTNVQGLFEVSEGKIIRR